MICPHANRPAFGRVLVTGATGFIGHYVLAALLRRGVACAALLRPPLADSAARLAELLRPLGVDLQRQVVDWRLALIEGDMNHPLPAWTGLNLDAILHIAGVTVFQRQPNGDPERTNVHGTSRLLDWARAQNIRTFHLVSSAYSCGQTDQPVPERIAHERPTFLNEYERSKWESEHLADVWAQSTGGTLTVFRPSIVVGDQQHGRTTSFSGFYVLARANEMLSQWYDHTQGDRRATGLRIECRPDGVQNLVPVDYVADMMAHAVAEPAWHGRVYHLTHPDPPRNATIKRAIDEHFGFDGSRFLDDQPIDETDLSEPERVFYESTRVVRRYLTHHPQFSRTQASLLEAACGARCRPMDVARLRSLLSYAREVNWGRRAARPKKVQTHAHDEQMARYFEDYLPRRVALSQVARMTALTTSMRFVIRDAPDAQWVCHFVKGMLVSVERTGKPAGEKFTYTTTRDVFWRAVAGKLDPQQVFLNDLATIRGDIEAAIKMMMILHQFNCEHPCTPADLALEEPALC